MPAMKAPEMAITRLETEESRQLDYPDYKRAHDNYSTWMCGYTPEEIAEFEGMDVKEVLKDLRYVEKTLSPRASIAHGNDRLRLIQQRAEAASFSRLMKESLAVTAKEYIAQGLSPVAALKEFREAVGMTEKPGTFVTFAQQTNNFGPGPGPNKSKGDGIKSSEDLCRMVLKQIADQELASRPTVDTTAEVLEGEVEETIAPEDTIPDDD